MAEVVEVPVGEASGGIGGAWSSVWNFVINYWFVLVLVALLAAAVVVAFMFYMKKEENDRRRDSATYATAMDYWESARQNAKKEWIRNGYSLWNLLWFGIPFKRREHSVKLLDMDRNIIGWYRGHTRTQDGDIIYLCYRTKSLLGLKEDKFLLYCARRVNAPHEEDGKIVYKPQVLPDDMVYYDRTANEIRVKANTVLRHGNYYYFPNYVFMDGDKMIHLDLSDHISRQIAKINHTRLIENAYTDFSKAVGRAVEVNPMLRYGQKEPEKHKEISENEENRSS